MISVIRTHLLGMLGAVTSIQIIPDGVNYTPQKQSDYPFIRFRLLPRESVLETLGTNYLTREAGLLNMTLWLARSTNSIDTGLTTAETIKAAFTPRMIPLTGNQLILNTVWIEAVMHEPSGIGIPILVRWTNIT